MFVAAKSRAVKSGIPFTITEADITVPDKCPALGIPLVGSRGEGVGGRPNSPSLDRIVPSLGYVPGNIAVISFKANAIKRDASLKELRGVLQYMEQVSR